MKMNKFLTLLLKALETVRYLFFTYFINWKLAYPNSIKIIGVHKHSGTRKYMTIYPEKKNQNVLYALAMLAVYK